MRQSQLFTKTRKDISAEEVSKNAQLLTRAGFIYKEMAGAYAYLPLGLRVIEKIKQVVREEMESVGGQEMLMTALQRKEVWETTNRWDDEVVDVWFKSELKNGTEVGFGWSHEEPITEMMKHYIHSYRDLPIFVYQFQTKLRNELRAKSGIMRGREFLMKDMYSYCIDEAQHQAFYAATIEAYLRVFARVGLKDQTFVTYASGGAFTEFSHEFQTITEAGEDKIFINKEKNIAINEEVLSEETLKELGVSRDELTEVKTAEVGNIFNFGRKKCEEMGLNFVDSEGTSLPVFLGSYGIGISRLMGTIVEVYHDEKGIIWPKEIAPFQVHLISLNQDERAEALYTELTAAGIEVLFDDRDMRAGAKFADSDLIGLPLRIVMSNKTIEQDAVEIKLRAQDECQLVLLKELTKEKIETLLS
ncbi:prolyl-tRNA synthetase [Patescibacteria group bacterium]|nr:prolyl-tRNA synthetase [Patescibacteria group bacterium]MBU1721983.1 prolyl-tRNA synthetase [Patescibacteria group bacterium]MBU1901268.1 prolyl-tRNA synthetase [Patescibacteria group bacterium]